MPLSGDYIDGGPGDDCIVLEGPGDRIVIGGTGNDRTITVPAGTSDATIERIFAHCSDPAYLAGMGATTPQPEDKPAPPPLSATTQVPRDMPRPVGGASFQFDGGAFAMLCTTLLALVVVANRYVR
jgi:hypothetical protein